MPFKDSLPTTKYCLSCFSHLEKSTQFKDKLQSAFFYKENVDNSNILKRPSLGTPTPQKLSQKRTRTNPKSKTQLFTTEHSYSVDQDVVVSQLSTILPEHSYNMRKTLQEQAQTAIEEKHKALLIKNQMENNSDLLDGLVHISGQLEVLSSSTEPGPSVLKAYSNPKDFLDKDILSEAIIEMDR